MPEEVLLVHVVHYDPQRVRAYACILRHAETTVPML